MIEDIDEVLVSYTRALAKIRCKLVKRSGCRTDFFIFCEFQRFSIEITHRRFSFEEISHTKDILFGQVECLRKINSKN